MTALAAYSSYDTSLISPSLRRSSLRERLTDDANGSWFSGEPSTSVFGVNRSPNWLPDILNRLVGLVRLPRGWDGHDGQPVKIDVASFAIQFILETSEPNISAPQIVPLSYGGIQLEWHEHGIDLEIEIQAPNKTFVSFKDHRTGEEFESEFSTDYAEVMRVMRVLASSQRC